MNEKIESEILKYNSDCESVKNKNALLEKEAKANLKKKESLYATYVALSENFIKKDYANVLTFNKTISQKNEGVVLLNEKMKSEVDSYNSYIQELFLYSFRIYSNIPGLVVNDKKFIVFDKIDFKKFAHFEICSGDDLNKIISFLKDGDFATYKKLDDNKIIILKEDDFFMVDYFGNFYSLLSVELTKDLDYKKHIKRLEPLPYIEEKECKKIEYVDFYIFDTENIENETIIRIPNMPTLIEPNYFHLPKMKIINGDKESHIVSDSSVINFPFGDWSKIFKK